MFHGSAESERMFRVAKLLHAYLWKLSVRTAHAKTAAGLTEMKEARRHLFAALRLLKGVRDSRYAPLPGHAGYEELIGALLVSERAMAFFLGVRLLPCNEDLLLRESMLLLARLIPPAPGRDESLAA